MTVGAAATTITSAAIAGTGDGLQKLGMAEPHATATATGIVVSVQITFLAVALGAIVQATADGVHSFPALWVWCKDGHLWGYVVAQFVAPAARGYLAYRNSKKGAPPPAEGANP